MKNLNKIYDLHLEAGKLLDLMMYGNDKVNSMLRQNAEVNAPNGFTLIPDEKIESAQLAVKRVTVSYKKLLTIICEL